MKISARLAGDPVADLPLCDRAAVTLLANIENAVWMYDLIGHRVRWANRAALRFWKAGTLDELMQRDFQPNSQGTADRLEILRHELAHGGRISDQWTLYPQGEPSHVLCHFSGVRFADGAMGMMVEVTGPRHSGDVEEIELRAIEAFRQTPRLVSLVTIQGHWLMHNPAAEVLMAALDLHNIPNVDNFLDMFADRQAADVLRHKALEEGTAQAKLQIVGRKLRMHDVILRRVVDPVTGKLSLMVMQQDITQMVKLERRLEKALAREQEVVQTQRHFLSMTSHEFRTPLAIIENAVRRIARRLPQSEPVIVEKLDMIRSAVRRMSVAIDHTLSATRIAEGKVAFHPVAIEVQEPLQQALDVCRSLHPDRPFRLELADLPKLMIDPGLIEQVCENLLTNAIKYSPPGSAVEICGRVADGMVVLSIADHGIGVPKSDIPMLFTRYFRSSNARGIKGTGIGLHTVRYLMQLHGGMVSFESEEGKGTIVTLSFPVARDAA